MKKDMPEHSNVIRGASTLNIVAGALILLVPFFTNAAGAALWSNLLAGIAVIALAGYNVYAAGQRHAGRVFGPALANVAIGLWVLASGFLLAAPAAYMTWNVVLGVVLAAAAGYNTYAASKARGTTRPRTM